MTKTNMILALFVLLLGVVATVTVLEPQIVDKLIQARQSRPSGASSVPVRNLQDKTREKNSPPAWRAQETVSKPDPSGASQAQKPESVQEKQEPPMAEIRTDFTMAGADVSIKAESYDDWRVECAEFKDGKTICNMNQRLAWEQNTKVTALMVVMTMTEREGKPIPRMRLLVPLGTYLPAGLAIAMKGEEEINVKFQFCSPEGCTVTLDLADEVVKQLKAKDSLTVGYLRPDSQVAQMKVSLKGFTKAFERISGTMKEP